MNILYKWLEIFVGRSLAVFAYCILGTELLNGRLIHSSFVLITYIYLLFNVCIRLPTILFITFLKAVNVHSKNSKIKKLKIKQKNKLKNKSVLSCPGWCSSVDWVQAANQRVAGSIPSQGTCLRCRPGTQ